MRVEDKHGRSYEKKSEIVEFLVGLLLGVIGIGMAFVLMAAY